MPLNLFITGATGNVGLATLKALAQWAGPEVTIRAAATDPARAAATHPDVPVAWVAFDFLHPDPAHFQWADRMLLVRPPQLSDVKGIFAPCMDLIRQGGVQQIVFLSLQGASGNPVTPHHKIEKLIVASQIPYVFLQPSFFMQNLSTTHLAEIRDRDEIFIPAGEGKTNFVDVADIGEVAARMLLDPPAQSRSIELTGREAFSYSEIARLLSHTLGRTITYRKPGLVRFVVRKIKEGQPLGFVLVMAALYSVARLGKAAGYSPEMEEFLGRPPRTMADFVAENAPLWTPKP